jgi:hypothetical protein
VVDFGKEALKEAGKEVLQDAVTKGKDRFAKM